MSATVNSLITLTDAARRAGVSRQYLHRQMKRGKIEAHRDKLTGRWVVTVREFERWCESRKWKGK